MSSVRKRYASASRPGLARRFYVAGYVVLACGLLAAALVYTYAPADASYQLPYSRQDDAQVERLGGRAAVWVLHFNRWFLGLWHGRQLAWTLAGLSLAIALLCLLAGRSLSATMPFGTRPRK
ncbi:hypothetical protein [Candidimonas nitroreducens]|uniref:Uncharacterized protein n=1 Tax=Candidimonas nitroreducens TaxID=683354 RepID=A0A225LYG5_9BURK|nr:hypothetical protein [Candidimonas nitroreducens]OWT54224.1 hypothetical protein CEY11_22945 [Candidimonas nitroreducens]